MLSSPDDLFYEILDAPARRRAKFVAIL